MGPLTPTSNPGKFALALALAATDLTESECEQVWGWLRSQEVPDTLGGLTMQVRGAIHLVKASR